MVKRKNNGLHQHLLNNVELNLYQLLEENHHKSSRSQVKKRKKKNFLAFFVVKNIRRKLKDWIMLDKYVIKINKNI
jgi:hypothetical protein